MTLIYLVVILVVVGLLVGFIAGLIWKDDRPIGVQGDYLVAIASTVIIGLLDWYVIPAMGFSPMMRNIGVALEPPLGALAVLWLIRVAKKQ